jgi:hypothetical protein
VLQGRLTVGVASVAALVMLASACSGDKPIENLERVGATAIDNATDLQCTSDYTTLAAAIEQYTTLSGAAPTDETMLIAEGFLREESPVWDIVDGRVVATDSSCTAPSTTAPATTTPNNLPTTLPITVPVMTAPATTIGDIVTSTIPLTADEAMAEFTPEDIASVGGQECARELAEIFAASQRMYDATGAGPETLDELAPYLDVEITLWDYDAEYESLVPSAGSSCIRIDALDRAEECVTDLSDVEAALAEYEGDPATVTQADLVAANLLGAESELVTIDAGTAAIAPGSVCETLDLELAYASKCVADAKTYEVATEAYYAQFGEYPTSGSDLFEAQLVRAESKLVELTGNPPVVVAVAGGPCEDIDLDD